MSRRYLTINNENGTKSTSKFGMYFESADKINGFTIKNLDEF